MIFGKSVGGCGCLFAWNDVHDTTGSDTLAQTYGAMFVLENGSSCEVLVLLEPDDSGAITNERVYFDTRTLGSCDE